MPVKASAKRKKFMRKVNWYDIHWRNCELLTDFLTESGRIQSRY